MYIVYRRPFKDGEPSHNYDMEHGEAHGPFETEAEATKYANALPYWQIVTLGGYKEPCIMKDQDGNLHEFENFPDLEAMKWLGDYEIKKLQKI